MRRHLTLATTLLLALALAACGDSPAVSGTPPPGSGDSDQAVLVIADGDPVGDGIRVVDAAAHRGLGDVVVVSGALFVAADGSVLLCDAIAESFPPQCGGARMAVEGLDLDTIELEEANGVRWSEGVILLGSVE